MRERPEVVAPWIVLGLAAALAGLIAGGTAVLLVVGIGLFILRWVPGDAPVRQALILGWVAAMAGVIVIIALVEGATGYTGIATLVGLVVALPIAGRALYLIIRG